MNRKIALLLMLCDGPASACFISPKHFSATPDQLVDRTSNIVLATVIRAEVSGQEVVYTFTTLRTIKGKSKKEFQLRGESSLYPAQSDDFDRHEKKEFWSYNGMGRLTMDTDCKVHPSFSVGGTYLAFLDQPFHSKSFELIHATTGNREDRWLKYVLNRAGP